MLNSLIVLNGRHRGARIHVGDDAVVIGAGPDVTASLTDAQIQGSAVEVISNNSGKLLASCSRGQCSLGGRVLKQHGKARAMRPGNVLEIGAIKVSIGSDLVDAQSRIARASQSRAYTTCSVAALLIVVLSVSIGMSGGIAKPEIGESFGLAEASLNDNAVSDAAEDLRLMLQEARLSDVNVGFADDGGHIIAAGKVAPEARERLEQILRWFDGKYGARVMLESELDFTRPALVLPFDIRGVSLQPRARIVLHDGSVHGLGAVLPGGWNVESIDAAAVRLSRDENILTVNF